MSKLLFISSFSLSVVMNSCIVFRLYGLGSQLYVSGDYIYQTLNLYYKLCMLGLYQ